MESIVKFDGNLSMPIKTRENIKDMLYAHDKDLQGLLPKSVKYPTQRVVKALMDVVRDPKVGSAIFRCTAGSVLASAMKACELGLDLSKELGQACLIPRGGICTLLIQYRGYDVLILRTFKVHSMDSDVVYNGDKLKIVKGTTAELIHEPDYTKPREDADIIGAYSVANFKEGPAHFEYMTIEAIKKARSCSPDKYLTFWKKWFSQMCRKTVKHSHAKYLPLATERAEAVEVWDKALAHDHEVDGVIDVEPESSAKDATERLLSDEPIDGVEAAQSAYLENEASEGSK